VAGAAKHPLRGAPGEHTLAYLHFSRLRPALVLIIAATQVDAGDAEIRAGSDEFAQHDPAWGQLRESGVVNGKPPVQHVIRAESEVCGDQIVADVQRGQNACEVGAASVQEPRHEVDTIRV